MRKIIYPMNINTKAKAKNIFGELLHVNFCANDTSNFRQEVKFIYSCLDGL